jgi:serine/threonine protein kinase
MNSLHKKIIKGIFPDLPKHYSSELYLLISKLLTVDPLKRPSAEDVLHMDIFMKRNGY